MSHYYARPNNVARLHEKHALQDITGRLSSYIQHVRNLADIGKKDNLDSASFLESIRILEEELVTLKDMYENELDNLRKTMDELSREKARYSTQCDKNNAVIADLEGKLATETDKHRKAIDELNVLHQTLARKEQDIVAAKNELIEPKNEIERLQRDYCQLLREKEDVKRRLHKEIQEHQQADDKLEQMANTMEFKKHIFEKEKEELYERLNVAENTILDLEGRIREMQLEDGTLKEMLQRVRDAAEAELLRYQEESRAAFNHNLTVLKMEIEDNNRKIDDITSENENLRKENAHLAAKIKSLEGTVGSSEHQRRALEDLVTNERLRAQDQNNRMEKKVRDVQDLLVTKMREVSLARDAQVSLKAEIESMKHLLEEEERRLKIVDPMRPPKVAFTTPNEETTEDGLPHGPPPMASNALPISKPNPPLGPVTTAEHEPSRITSPPLGPVRARSAPARASQKRLIPTGLGQGEDYFNRMFKDLKTQSLTPPKTPSPPPEKPYASEAPGAPGNLERVVTPSDRSGNEDRPASSTSHDYTTCTSSATGDFHILEVHPEGKYVRLLNASKLNKEDEFGGYMVQQNVGGNPVAVYRFPPRTKFLTNSTITVWSGTTEPIKHQPPTDFVWKEQQKWGTGPECTTILCKPNGQAVAWMTAAHRFTRDAYDQTPTQCTTPIQHEEGVNHNDPRNQTVEMEELTELSMDFNAPKPDPVYLRREKDPAPSLVAQKHPHGTSPPSAVHPSTGQGRQLTYGNDNSSVNRQSRSQSGRPDPIPGAPYAGAAAQRMGSASLRRYSPTNNSNVRGSGAIANKAMPTLAQ